MTEVIEQFHSQLEQIARAKIPLILEPHCRLPIQVQLANILERVQASYGSDVDRVMESVELPANYRIALDFWLRGQYQSSLDQLSARAESHRFFHQSIHFVALQTLLILGAAFLGLVAATIWLFPRMEAIIEPQFNEPGPGLRQLAWLRNTLPIWGTAVPLLVVISWFVWRRIAIHRVGKWSQTTDSVWLSKLHGLHGLSAQKGQFRVWTGVAMVICGLFVLGCGLSLFWPVVELLLLVSEP